MAVVLVGAQKSERSVAAANADADVTFRRKLRTRDFFPDQEVIDETIGRQTWSGTPVKDRTVRQRILRDAFLKGRGIRSPGFPISRLRPFKRDSFHMLTTLGDAPLFKNAARGNRELREERTVLGNSPFVEQSGSLVPDEIFHGQAPTYESLLAPFKKQLFTAKTPFRNLFYGQSPSDEQASLQKQTTFVEFPTGSMEFHRDASHGKPIDSYGQQKDVQGLFDEEPTIYTKYGRFVQNISREHRDWNNIKQYRICMLWRWTDIPLLFFSDIFFHYSNYFFIYKSHFQINIYTYIYVYITLINFVYTFLLNYENFCSRNIFLWTQLAI